MYALFVLSVHVYYVNCNGLLVCINKINKIRLLSFYHNFFYIIVFS